LNKAGMDISEILLRSECGTPKRCQTSYQEGNRFSKESRLLA
jgi:hypothetical protein